VRISGATTKGSFGETRAAQKLPQQQGAVRLRSSSVVWTAGRQRYQQ